MRYPSMDLRASATNQRRGSRCRGGAYLLVLTTAMLVATIGLAGLEAARVERQARLEEYDAVQAAYLAHAAIELGLGMIATDANWRINHGAGAWISSQALDPGTLALETEFMADADSDPSNNPVELTGEGRVREAIQRVRVIVAPAVEGGGLIVQPRSWTRTGA